MEFNATFFVSIISFVLFVFIMNKIFYAPVSRIILERENMLKQNFDEADEVNSTANSILKNRDEKLNKAEANSREIIAQKIDEYNNISKREIAEANIKAKEEIQIRKTILEEENHKAENELKNKEKALAQLISSKVLGFDVAFEENFVKEGSNE